jgi:hypothetical protein
MGDLARKSYGKRARKGYSQAERTSFVAYAEGIDFLDGELLWPRSDSPYKGQLAVIQGSNWIMANQIIGHTYRKGSPEWSAFTRELKDEFGEKDDKGNVSFKFFNRIASHMGVGAAQRTESLNLFMHGSTENVPGERFPQVVAAMQRLKLVNYNAYYLFSLHNGWIEDAARPADRILESVVEEDGKRYRVQTSDKTLPKGHWALDTRKDRQKKITGGKRPWQREGVSRGVLSKMAGKGKERIDLLLEATANFVGDSVRALEKWTTGELSWANEDRDEVYAPLETGNDGYPLPLRGGDRVNRYFKYIVEENLKGEPAPGARAYPPSHTGWLEDLHKEAMNEYRPFRRARRTRPELTPSPRTLAQRKEAWPPRPERPNWTEEEAVSFMLLTEELLQFPNDQRPVSVGFRLPTKLAPRRTP